MSFVGTLLPWLDRQFHDLNGQPLAGGKIESWVAGESPHVTHKFLYADALLTTPLSDPCVLDTEGRITAFMESGAYDFLVYDADDVFQYSVEGVEDYGATFLGQLGVMLAQGSALVTSGYTVLPTDTLVTVNSTGGASPCVIQLPNCTTHPLPLTILNFGTEPLSVTPFSVQTINGVNGVYTVPIASGILKPGLGLVNDGIRSWFVTSTPGI